MIKILNIICPIKLQLNILQLEEYKPLRFLNWILKNFLKREIQTKKPIVYTVKIKNIILIYTCLCLLSFFITPFISVILITQPYIGLIIALLILKPYEIYNRYKTIENSRKKILSLRNLNVIGVTGSFGKTSTKEILYQILKNKHKTLRTPESFNTIFGVAKVVDLELDNSYEYFICEMAAYKIGEIKILCYMVPPQYAILTGITTQHFERFGSLENTVKAKFELINAIMNKNNIVYNLDDDNVLNELKRIKTKISNNILSAKNITFDKNGSNFDLVINKNTYKIKTSLFGSANIKNIIIAANLATKLGFSNTELVEAIKNLKPFDNRNVLVNDKRTTIVNNTYSSNIQSFRETLKTAKKINGKKVLVTPGIVELGSLEKITHENLGKEAQGVFDKIILVGKNDRTNSFASGLDNNYKFIEDTRAQYSETIEKLKKDYEWIFLENDLTQNY